MAMRQVVAWAMAVALVVVLGACGAPADTPAPADTAAPLSPLPTASAMPAATVPAATETATGTPGVSEPTYQRVELGGAELALDVPGSWQRRGSEWAWSPTETSAVRVGVQWVDLQPPMEAEAVLLPPNAQVLDAQELELGWGQARQFDVEVYGQAAPGSGERAPVASVERHVLVVMAGQTRRAYDLYAAAPTAEALAPALPVLERMVASAQVPAIAQAGLTRPAEAQTQMVPVFFGSSALDPNAQNCSAVWPVERQVPAAAKRLDAALNELFAGPTPAEREEGYTSWFSLDTANLLVDAFVEGDRAYVNLGDLRPLIPSASSSCGSAQLLAQMGQTVQAAAPGVTRVLYAIEGSPQPFWEWLQIGCDEANDFCDPVPFQKD